VSSTSLVSISNLARLPETPDQVRTPGALDDMYV
jgi:hypothetical protein